MECIIYALIASQVENVCMKIIQPMKIHFNIGVSYNLLYIVFSFIKWVCTEPYGPKLGWLINESVAFFKVMSVEDRVFNLNYCPQYRH